MVRYLGKVKIAVRRYGKSSVIVKNYISDQAGKNANANARSHFNSMARREVPDGKVVSISAKKAKR